MTDPTTTDRSADSAWFRSHVEPVLDATPVEDAWSRIEGRIAGPAVAPAEHRSGLRTRWLAAVAAIALVAAGAAIVLTSRDRPGDTDSVATEPAAVTGWYVPVGLPDGWKLETVSASPGQEVCARRGAQWSDPQRDRSLIVEFDACGRAMTADDLPNVSQPNLPPEASRNPSLQEVDLGGGTTATGMRMPSADPDLIDVQGLGWNDGKGAWSLHAVGLGYDQQVAVAKRFAADPTRTDTGIDGLREVDRWSTPARERTASVEAVMVNPDGLRATFSLALPGLGQRAGGSSVLVPVEVSDQPNPVLRFDSVGFWAVRYGGAWPGADLTFMRLTTGPTDPEHMITDAGLEQLIGSLRPASSDEWRSFLETASAGVSPALLTAPSLEGLAAQDFARPGEPGGDLVMATTTTSAAPTTTGATGSTSTTAPAAGPVTSAIGTAVPVERPLTSNSELEGLTIRLELASGTVRAGSPVAGTLIIENTTTRDIDLTECSEGRSRWGLVPIDDPDQPLSERQMTDCFDTSVLTIPAGSTIRYRSPAEDPAGVRWPFRAQRPDPSNELQVDGLAGTLPGGDYLAVLEVPGRTFDLRASVPVTVPDPTCPTTDAVVERYVNLTASEARTRAEHDGWRFRIVSGPGAAEIDRQSVDCDRINVDLDQDGSVSNALRY